MLSPAEIKWVTCSECGETVLGESMRKKHLPKRFRRAPQVAVRVFGRPRCSICVDAAYAEVSRVQPNEHEPKIRRCEIAVDCFYSG